MLYHSAKVQLADTEPSILGITSCETTHPTIALQWRHRAPPCHHATGRYRSTQSSRPIFAVSTQVRGRGRSFTYNELLNELDVRASLLRQVVVRLGVRRGLVPPLEFLILNRQPCQRPFSSRRETQLLTTTSHRSSRPRSAGKKSSSWPVAGSLYATATW